MTRFALTALILTPCVAAAQFPGPVYTPPTGPVFPGGRPGTVYPGGTPGVVFPGGRPGIVYPGGQPGVVYPGGTPGLTFPQGQPGLVFPGTRPGTFPQPPGGGGMFPQPQGGGKIVKRASRLPDGRMKIETIRVLPGGRTQVINTQIQGGSGGTRPTYPRRPYYPRPYYPYR